MNTYATAREPLNALQNGADTARRSIIQQELDQLEKISVSIEEALKSHVQKIQPVLRLEPTPCAEKTPGEPSTGVALGDRIAATSRRLANACQIIRDVTSIVEL